MRGFCIKKRESFGQCGSTQSLASWGRWEVDDQDVGYVQVPERRIEVIPVAGSDTELTGFLGAISECAPRKFTQKGCSQWPTTGSVGIVLVQEWPLSGPLQRAETQRMGLNLSTQLSSSKPSPAMEQAAWGGCWGCF